MKVFEGDNGFGLIEVVIAAGIMMIIMLGVSSLMVTGQKGAQSIERHLDAGQLQSYISTIFNNQAVCSQASTGLVGQPAPAPKLPTTKDVTPIHTLDFAGLKIDDYNNNLFDNNQILITELKYHSVSISGSIYSVLIRLQVSMQGASNQLIVGGNTLPPVDFPVVFTVAGGVIKSCGTNISLGQITSNCTTYESGAVGPNNYAAQGCPITYPYALNGGCNGPLIGGSGGRINSSYIANNTQYCLSDGGNIDAYITCCQ